MKAWFVGLKYALSSITCFLVDNGLFTLINKLLASNHVNDSIRRLIAVAVARICSSIVNYLLNSKVVFKSDENAGKSAVKYYILVVGQLGASYLLLNIIAGKLFNLNGGIMETVVKMCVDSLLFIASFQIQKKWVFKKKD